MKFKMISDSIAACSKFITNCSNGYYKVKQRQLSLLLESATRLSLPIASSVITKCDNHYKLGIRQREYS